MEYLVTMTTDVPHEVDVDVVREVRKREAARTRTLALEGRVVRLWRPPLEPGEWRTLGLFAAEGTADLEHILASMPLRMWRTDEVIRLDPHPNDPGSGRVPLDQRGMEFLTTFRASVPPEVSPEAVAAVTTAEARRASELADEGRLLRLWTLPGHQGSLGHWRASDRDGMRAILRSLPMPGWLNVETVRLSRHPSDPATAEWPDTAMAAGTDVDRAARR